MTVPRLVWFALVLAVGTVFDAMWGLWWGGAGTVLIMGGLHQTAKRVWSL